MTQEELSLQAIKNVIDKLPAAQKEACHEMIAHIKHYSIKAGELASIFAITYLEAEMQVAAAANKNQGAI